MPMKQPQRFYLITPSVMTAMQDVLTHINKAMADTGIEPNSVFTPNDILTFLKSGCDEFNAKGIPTGFSMLNAQNSFRHFWLGYSKVAAMRAQYLVEGMKAFDYQGQVVQLTIDRTQFWDSAASILEQSLDQAVLPFKKNLGKRGILDGDGSQNPNRLRNGAVGHISIGRHLITPRGTGLRSPVDIAYGYQYNRTLAIL